MVQKFLLSSKLHRATVTDASLHYEGSMTISEDLLEAAHMNVYERILVGNIANGERFETYVIPGERGKGIISLNGATAHLGKIGDRLVIMTFASVDADKAATHVPSIVLLNEKNEIIDRRGAAR